MDELGKALGIEPDPNASFVTEADAVAVIEKWGAPWSVKPAATQ